MGDVLVETAIEPSADEPPERRVALADEGAESILDDLEAESARGDRRHEVARAQIRLTLQEAALFGEPTTGLRGPAGVDMDALEVVDAEQRAAVEAGVEIRWRGRRASPLLRNFGGEPRDDLQYLG